MKSLVDLFADLLQDCGGRSGAPVHRDVCTLRERVAHEGDSFLTITLPVFCKDFERSLAEGRVAPGSFLSFKKEASGIPSFLKGFLCRVFDDGAVLRQSPSIDCIRSVRQICLFGKKVLRPCLPKRVEAAIAGYYRCENEISSSESQMHRYFKHVAAMVIVATGLDEKCLRARLTPSHGPGATQEHISGNQKWRFLTWNARLQHAGFTYVRFGRGTATGFLPCRHHFPDLSEAWPDLVEPEDEEPVRVVFVPKTLKTPRVIAVEPVCMQFAQQALKRWLVDRLQSRSLTTGHVNFTDQTVNQALAISVSKTGHMATLDMAEASDRVSLALVEDMFAAAPDFRSIALACRSTRAELPNGEVIRLKKFASMGSALCFPVEALVFFTSIIASRILRAGRFPTARLVSEMAQDVYVYGDDLIVPADEAPAICTDLETIGLKVNRDKSFWTGQFRESCGVDAYDGEVVSPIYLRRDWPADRTGASEICSLVATANQLEKAGYPRSAASIRHGVEKFLGELPETPVNSPALGWHRKSKTAPSRRWNRAYQRFEYLCWVPISPMVPDDLDGLPAMAKCWGLIGSSDPIDPRHLTRSVRPYGLALKRRWVPNPSLG